MATTSKTKAASNAFRSERNKRLIELAPDGTCYICHGELPERTSSRGKKRVLCGDVCAQRSSWITCETPKCRERAPYVVSGILRCGECRDDDNTAPSPPPAEAEVPRLKPPPARNLDVVRNEAALRRFEKQRRDELVKAIGDARRAVVTAQNELKKYDASVLDARRTRALEFVNNFFLQNGS